MTSQSSAATIKKRTGYMNDGQKNVLIEFLAKHPELEAGKFSLTFSQKKRQELWQEVTAQLHQILGAVEDWKSWRKSWHDFRSSAKPKSSLIKNSYRKTGGGPPSSQILSETDQNVLALLSKVAVNGHDSVAESSTHMQWDYEEGDFNNVEFSDKHYEDQNLLSTDGFIQPDTNHDLSRHPLSAIHETNNTDGNNNRAAFESQSAIKNTTVLSSQPKTDGKRTSAAMCYEKSTSQTEMLTNVSREDCDIINRS